MRQLIIAIIATITLASCTSRNPSYYPSFYDYGPDSLITQSLFNDKSATISEENIQKILDGSFKLPSKLRVAIVRLESSNPSKRFQWRYWADEQYLKSQQAYLDQFTEKFKQSTRVTTVSLIPEMLISKTPSFTSLREAAVRLQADVVVVYSINSDIYSDYKLFSRPDIKAFATTQLIVLDVRTGLVPFSAISTKDVLSQRKKEETGNVEATNRVQNEAVLLTISEIGDRITAFLNSR